ncbi:MAG TPA: DUF3106 domain-containing protein [Bryobacteraceae bacterium]|jgi:hypothetical protein|nr:DUF3106 domain-containing protein [Bryobacteraceae bacterium]
MLRRIQVVGILLLGSWIPSFAANKRQPPPHPPPAAAAPPKAPPKLGNPGTVAQRLLQMSPDERERVISRFPPERQAQIRQRLQKLDSLPKQQQDRVIERYQTFSSLPPEKQNLVRRQIQAFNALPDDRRRVVGAAFQRLRRMPEAERQELLARPGFKVRFTPEEHQMLSDLSANWPAPTN